MRRGSVSMTAFQLTLSWHFFHHVKVSPRLSKSFLTQSACTNVESSNFSLQVSLKVACALYYTHDHERTPSHATCQPGLRLIVPQNDQHWSPGVPLKLKRNCMLEIVKHLRVTCKAKPSLVCLPPSKESATQSSSICFAVAESSCSTSNSFGLLVRYSCW